MEGEQPADLGGDRWRARANPRASPRARFRADERDSFSRPEVFERGNLYHLDPRHRPVKNDVRAADLLGKNHAVLVFSCYARTVTLISLRLEQIVSRDGANARARRRVPGIRDRVELIGLEVGDSRILDAPLLIRSFPG